MRVALRRLGLAVSQQFSDDRKTGATADGYRRKGVSQVVQADVC